MLTTELYLMFVITPSVHMLQVYAFIITDGSRHNDTRINARKTNEMIIRPYMYLS